MALLGPRLPRLTRGWMPWLELTRAEPKPLPDRDWVRIRPRLSGICGTDIALLTGHSSPVLTPFAAFPAVLGHEVVGEVIEAGEEAARAWHPGDRVVVDPVISCAMRGLEPCAQCGRGMPCLCLRQADGRLGPGILMGFTAGLPGAWSDELVAHVSQLYRVPDEVPDRAAVLVEPFSVSLHAVLSADPQPGERVLVVGAGTIGLGAVAGMALLAEKSELTVLARHPAQESRARRLGATRVVRERGAASADVALAEAAGARLHHPITGPPVASGGFDVILDCVGSGASLDLALRFTGPGGRIVIVGGPTVIRSLDWTLVWTRELRLMGSFVYGREAGVPGEPHTFELALRLLAEHPDLPIAELVTHRFPLSRWRQAIRVSLERRSGAAKVVLVPG
jgi:L-iditol 2-dehydrogenase